MRRHLDLAFERAAEGAELVVEVERRRHGRGESLRKPLLAACKRAGVPVWGKLFTNLRSSCATDLASLYPVHVASAWMGHSVAAKHYWQVTDDHFAVAAGAAESGAVALRNPVPHEAAPVHAEPQASAQPVGVCGAVRAGAYPCSVQPLSCQE